ncbi:MAG: hypothetical protein IJQ23_02110 [Clostridia bacterium]|nr:hypothetical protein [Clostridia bacterium]
MKWSLIFIITIIMVFCCFSACDFNTSDKNSTEKQVGTGTNVETVDGSGGISKSHDGNTETTTETGTDGTVGGENENGQENNNNPGYVIVEPISDGGTFKK